MPYIIQIDNRLGTPGRYAQLYKVGHASFGGMCLPEVSMFSTPDHQDATQFDDPKEAKRQLKKNGMTGKLLVVNDDGYFPCPD